MERVWECKIGGPVGALPAGADGLMRDAVADAYQGLTGTAPEFVFSGWGGSLTEPEQAVVEDREPRANDDVSALRAEIMTGWWEVDEAGRDQALARLGRIAAEAADLRRLFEMQWDRMTEATERWRSEDPEARSMTMPDLGALLAWLMDRAAPKDCVDGLCGRTAHGPHGSHPLTSLADENHWDVECDQRPDCKIAAHHSIDN